jgi:hypothetical protein
MIDNDIEITKAIFGDVISNMAHNILRSISKIVIKNLERRIKFSNFLKKLKLQKYSLELETKITLDKEEFEKEKKEIEGIEEYQSTAEALEIKRTSQDLEFHYFKNGKLIHIINKKENTAKYKKYVKLFYVEDNPSYFLLLRKEYNSLRKLSRKELNSEKISIPVKKERISLKTHQDNFVAEFCLDTIIISNDGYYPNLYQLEIEYISGSIENFMKYCRSYNSKAKNKKLIIKEEFIFNTVHKKEKVNDNN